MISIDKIELLFALVRVKDHELQSSYPISAIYNLLIDIAAKTKITECTYANF